MDKRMESLEALVISDVGAGYNGRKVVSGVSLSLQRGDILGVMGGNGSGKSTLLRAVTGQIRLMEGEVRIGGIDLIRESVRAKAEFGLAVDAPDLPVSLTGNQYVELVASIRGCSADDLACEEVIERLALSAWMDRPISEYSLGTRAKASIVTAMLGSPQLLIFDESLNGLDPLAAFQAKQIMRELAATARHAIIVSTHFVEAVPSLCNRAIFLSDGHVVQSWDAQGLADSNKFPGSFESCVMNALGVHSAMRPNLAR